MESLININGNYFKFNEENQMYECRGEVCYDDDHDEIPEQGLWDSALKLAKRLRFDGIEAQVSYSEKGWVEVQLN